MILKIIMKMKGCSMIRFINPNLNRRGGFPNANRSKFSNSIPSFDGSLDVESTLLWIDKIDGLFEWNIFSWRIKSSNDLQA